MNTKIPSLTKSLLYIALPALFYQVPLWGKDLAICTVATIEGEPLAPPVHIQSWEPSSNSHLLHMTGIYTSGDIEFTFAVPFNNDLAEATVSVGHAAYGGVRTDYIFSANLNKSNLTLTSMLESGPVLEIICKKAPASKVSH